MSTMSATFALAGVGYLFGSIPFAFLLVRRGGGRDLRTWGSGNLGAANVLRTSGVGAGVTVALLDMGKGALSVLLAGWLAPWAPAPAVAGLAAIVGHVYPVWLGFRGGKGVATACGVFALLTPLAILPAAGVFVIVVWATRLVSLGSLAGTLLLPPVAWLTGAPAPVVVAAGAAALIIVSRHRPNLVRLRAGTERRLGQRV
jgi:glycerol-3-phosphate acyltransferase PlsY